MSYSITDQGSGYQLTRLLENSRDWYFAERSLWRIGLVETSGGTFYGWWDASAFATPTLTDTGSTFTISWVNAQLTSVVVTGLRDSTHLSLRLSLTIVLRGTDATTYAINRVEFPRVAVKPYETYYKDLQHVALPSIDGLVQQDITDSASLLEMDISNLSFIEPDSTSAPKNIGGAQFTYTYHSGADAGLLIKTNDTKLRFKRWSWFGDGDYANFTLLHCPSNNLAATSYTLPFQVEILPQPGGDWYDGCTRYRDLVEEDDPPWLSKGKLYQRDRDEFEERAGMVVAIPVGGSYSSSWMLSESAALQLLLPWDCKLGLHTQDGNGENWPDYQYLGDTALLAIDIGYPTWFYILTHFTDSTGSFYADGGWESYMSQNPSEVIILDPDQEDVTSGNNVFFNMIHDETRGMFAESIARLLENDFTGTKQFYFDAGIHAGIQDHRTSLSNAQTGAGSISFHDARHDFYRGLDGATVSEHTQEFYGAVCSGMTMYGFFASASAGDDITGARRVGMYPTVYSEYQTFWSPLVDLTVLLNDTTQAGYVPLALHQLYIRFNLGMIPTMLLPTSPYSMHTGTNQAKITNAYVELVTARHYFGHYFRGKRLRPPAGCRERQIEDEGSQYEVTSDGLAAVLVDSEGDPTAVHCSIWQSHETPGAPLGIFLANENSTAKTFVLTMNRKDYPELAENEYLVTTSLANGSRTQVDRSLHGFSETITVPAESLVIMEAVSKYDCPGTLQLSNGMGALLLYDGTPMLKTWPQYLAQTVDPEEDNLILLADER